MLNEASAKRLLLHILFYLTVFFSSYNFVSAQNKSLRPVENLIIRNVNIGSQSFNVSAKKQDVISLEIKQNGTDVKIKLFNPQGLLAGKSDYPFSEQDIERIFVIANEDGIFRLEIIFKFSGEKGSISIKLNELRKSSADDLKRAEAERLFSQAQSLRISGTDDDRKKAAEVYEQSLAIWREINDEIGELRALSILSYLNRLLGNNEKSIELAKLILEFPDSAENNSYKSDALYQIGQIQFVTGNIDEAIKTQKKSLAQFSDVSARQANTFTALGNYYQNIAEFELAQNAFDQALNNIEQFPDMYNEAQIRHTLGLFFVTLRDFDSAIINLKLAANLREKFGNRRGQASSLSVLSMSYYYLKKMPESFEVLQKALMISQDVGDKEIIVDTLAYLAVNYRETGNPIKAVELLTQAISLFPEKDSPILAKVYITLGVTQTQLSSFSEARNNFEKSLLGYRKIGDIDGETRALYHFAKLERAENNLDEAKFKIERALEIHEYVQAKYNNIQYLSDFLEMRRGYFDCYIDILMRLDKERPDEGFALKALQVSENARMRTFIWQYREAIKNTPQIVDFQLLSGLQKIQQQIGEKLSSLAKAQSDSKQLKKIPEIEKSIADLNKRDESFKAQFRASNPNIANLAQPPILSLAEMQTELDDGTFLVEYSLGEQSSYLWIVGKNSFQSFALPKRAEIETQARNYYETLNSTAEVSDARKIDKKNSFEESEKLGRIILAEKLLKLSAKRLVLVMDGALNLIPLASLTYFDANQNKRKFLLENFDSVQVPSLTTLHTLRKSSIKPFAPQSLAIIADPVFSLTDTRLSKIKRLKNNPDFVSKDLSTMLRDFNLTALSRLPFTRTEAQKVAENAPNNTSLNFDFKASRERLLNGEFDHFDILHFATHGFLNNQHPELSGLVLSLVDEKGNAQNGFLRTQDLYLLKIKLQMVVLSACQTGLGKQVENEGLIGLTRGFLINGTPRVISSLWKVEDTATAELMSRFYRALLKENQSPSTALRTAQNELRQIPRFSHPRYWAGFVLTGEWH